MVESEEGAYRRHPLVVLSLVFSTFATYPSVIVTSLLLIEMGSAFGQSVGVMAQLKTLASALAFLSALGMGAASVRFSPKRLLMAGLLTLSVAALGSGSAPNIATLFAVYTLTGLGASMVEPMVNTLIAEHFSYEERPRLIGWAGAGGGVSYILGSYLVVAITAIGGWRLAFLGYAMVLPLIGLAMVSRGIPSRESKGSVDRVGLMEGFRAVASNRSALACLVGNMLASSMGQALYFFSFSFLRERYALSPGTTSLVFSAASVCFFAGSLLSGRFVGWLGRKNAVVAGMAVFSLASLVYPNLDEVWLAAFLIVAGHLFGALQYSASISYGLEQVPGFRGSMMSISSAFSYIGYAIGAGVGGAVLLVYGWGALGLSLGALGIAGSLIYTLFTTDPTSDISA